MDPSSTLFVLRSQSVKQSFVALRCFVKHSCINSSGQKIVSGGDSMDITSEVKVELFHWDNLDNSITRLAKNLPENILLLLRLL